MSRTAKAWLIAAAALILVGGLLFVGAMAINGWDAGVFGSARYDTVTYTPAEDFKSISIHADTDDIVIQPAADGRCSVVFLETEKEKHTAAVQGGTLIIEKTDDRDWFDHYTFFSGSPAITINLPGREYDSLVIEESTGEIRLPAGFTFGSIDITTSTGDVECLSSSVGGIRIETSTGDIHAENIASASLSLSVSMGRVEVRNAACEGNVEIGVSTGKAFLTDVVCRDLHSDGNTGDITLENVIAAGAITIERSTGDVTFRGCDAEELSVITDTGDVGGTLLSEKVFIVRSDTGHIEVPETVSGGKCKISTDTGDIRISIQ